MSKFIKIIVLLLIINTAAPQALAFDFVPNDAEYSSWPIYCKVVYVRVGSGLSSKWRARTTPAMEKKAQPYLGNETYGGAGVHHFCAGLVWLNRALFEHDAQFQAYNFRSALSETSYTYQRMEPEHPLFLDVSTHLARVHYETGASEEAFQILQRAIAERPNDARGYAVKSVFHYREGEYDAALKVLEQGNKLLNEQSPEIHYNLGLVLLKLNHKDRALIHARKAYQMGYPLPGLKRKLQKAGVWDDA